MVFDPAESTYLSLYRGTAAETAWAEVPSSPAMTQIPITGGYPQHIKDTVRTNVLDSLGMMGQLVQTAQGAQMTANFEFTFSDFQWIVASVCRNTFTTVAIAAATDIAAATTDDSFNSTTTNFVTAGIKANTWFRVAGFVDAANNGVFRAASVTTTKVVVNAKVTAAGVVTLSPNLVLEAAGPSIDIDGKHVRNGSTPISHLIEARVTDVATAHYESARGMRGSMFDLNVTTGQIITGSFQMQGERGRMAGASVGGASTAWSGEASLVSGLNVGTIIEGGALYAANLPQELSFTLNPNARVDRSIMSITPAGIGYGRWMASGTLRTYFESAVMRQKFMDHTATSFVMPMFDVSGNIVVWSFPSVQFATNDMAPTDPDSPLDAPYTWEAQPTGTAITDYMAQIDFIAA